MSNLLKKFQVILRLVVVVIIMTGTFVISPMPAAYAADGDLDTSMTGANWQNGTRIQPTSNKRDGAYDVMAKADGSWTVGGYWSNRTDSHTHHSWFLRQYSSVGGNPNPFTGDDSDGYDKDRLFWSPGQDHQKKTLEMADGRYAMVGYAGTSTTQTRDYDCVIAVRKTDGSLD